MRTLGKRIKAIRFMMADKKVSIWKKILIAFGIAYIIMPIEVLPDFFLPVGFIDDILLWGCILYYLKETLDEYWTGGKSKDFSKKYKNPLEDVEFEVKEDDQKGE
ncbi:MAG: DUF1232 domain-containing protein [Anaerovoracaceae bacterium]